MKRLLAIGLTLIATTLAYAEPAEHSDFTVKQIAENLGLKGGNWSVKFDEKCYAGFIITDISATGKKKQKTIWSHDAAFQHEFHVLKKIDGEDSGNSQSHKIKFSSKQIGEPEVEQIGTVKMKTQFSFGAGITYAMQLPDSGMQRHQTTNVEVKLGEPTMLYEFTTDESEREFRLEIIFATEKPEKKAVRKETE